jgi:hypothetical protein
LSSEFHKRALIISPQSWGEMFISKHHYAIELLKFGYRVYFINPPTERAIFGLPKIKFQTTNHVGVVVVNHSLIFSRYLKFHIPFLHNVLIYIQRWMLLQKLENPDLIISFDLTNNFPLRGLKCKKIFFAADEPRKKQNFCSANKADLIVSVSQHIIDLYDRLYPVTKKMLINHGLSEDFLNIPNDLSHKYNGINVGLSGNFLFNDIDYPILIQIINENPAVFFHFFGNCSIVSNIGADSNNENLSYLNKIKNYKNCVFHGVLGKNKLALELNAMDAFLICYKPEKGQSSGSNSHKILEFLSTGKIIFSSNFSFYNNSDLFVMNRDRADNSTLVNLFNEGIINLEDHNDEQKRIGRIRYAVKNTYHRNLLKILS